MSGARGRSRAAGVVASVASVALLAAGGVLLCRSRSASPAGSAAAPATSARGTTQPRLSPRSVGAVEQVNEPGFPPDATVLRGRVLSSTRAAIVGAKVAIARFDEPVAELLTDGDGRFSAVVEPGPIALSASAPGFVAETRAFEAPGPDPERGELELRLARAGTLVGRVVRDDSGEAVPGCEVHVGVEDDDNPVHPTTTTDAQGAFRVEGLAGGPYALTARGDHLHGQGARIVLAPGTTSASIVIRVRKVAQVRGRLELAPTGAPCAKGKVSLGSVIMGDLDADTDAEGRVLFPAVPPGSYVVDLACAGHIRSQRNGKLVVAAVDQDRVFVAREMPSIRGVVVDRAGEPLRGVAISAVRERPAPAPDDREAPAPEADEGASSHAFSDDDGAFTLHDLSVGSYGVQLDAYHPAASQRVMIADLGSPDPIRLVVDQKVLLGRLVDRDGNGIFPARVEIAAESSERNVLTDVDEQGRFRATYVGEATLPVRVEIAGRHLPIEGDDRVGEPTAGERSFVVAVPRGELRGKVIGAGGEPAVDTVLVVSCADGIATSASTDELGNVLVRHLPSDAVCDVQVSTDDGQTGDATKIAVGVPFTLRLLPPGTLRGIVDAAGRPFMVSVLGPSRSRAQRFSERSGAWEFRGVPAGALTVQIESFGAAGGVSVKLAPGETKAVRVALSPDEDAD